ncbi:response regulator [Butyrivibrio sp. X503]|uniref:response regulator n=1 Tax=Butyrivibrio sp. X503 TaxID=2364878 RepID=UPI000EA87B78|nr:response regulator [Butyrivibrio sp. X503]RKM54875.1 response regulator [Butyrivibrio sp. X503]
MENETKKSRLHSIKAQMRIIFATLIVIPIAILGIYAYIVSSNNLKAQTQAAMQGSIDVISYGIENNAKRETDVIKFFSYEEGFRRALDYADADPYTLTEQLKGNIEPLIWYYRSSDESIDDITIYSENIPRDSIGDFLKRPTTSNEQDWYTRCKNQKGAQWVTDRNGNVYIINSLLDAETTSKVIGMVVLKINKEHFFSVATQSAYLDNGILIVGDNKEIISHKKLKDEALDKKITQDIFKGKGEDNRDFIEGRNYFLMKDESLNNIWKLYYYVDRNELVADVFVLLESDFIIAIVLFILGYLAASVFSNWLCSRIENLNVIAEDIKRGDFEIGIEDKGKDEIHQLYDSMSDMAMQLKHMMSEINSRNERDLLKKENDIHYREWLFDYVVEKNNDILAIITEKTFSAEFITANAEAILGVPLKELKEDIRVLTKAQCEGEEERLGAILERCFKTTRAELIDEIRFENLNTGELLYYRGAVVCTIDDKGRRLAVALYDRTQEIKRNHQLQEALSAAETANKAKTNFLANMSHDFRTPMNAIMGFNLLLDKHYDEPDKVREYTNKITLASQNLLTLLNDVLDMSKIESGRTTLYNKEMALGLLLEEINSVIMFQAKAKNLEYVVKVTDMEHDIFIGDKQKINEILINVLGNAVKYTPEGGRIEFTINESPSTSEGFQNVKFTIKDTGIGMKPEYKDKIFEAFSREDKDTIRGIQGTGLGLAITKNLVDLMGGTIRVESEEGKGSTFIINLRLQVVEASDVDFWKKHGIERVMFIDANHNECEQLSSILNNDGVDVIESPTGFGAIHLLDVYQADNKPVDMIIVDQKVQIMTAPEIVKNIRMKDKRNNNILIIVMADDYSAIEDEARAAGANELVQKPLFISSLKQTIDDLAKRTKESAKEETKKPLAGIKILAAEDNDINADILTELMNMEGASVTRAENGKEAVRMFEESKEGDYDLILMDIQMPVMNGYEAAVAIRSIGTDYAKNLPIIAMTANAYADDVQKSLDAGMNAHIAKPIDINIVEKTILEFHNNNTTKEDTNDRN